MFLLCKNIFCLPLSSLVRLNHFHLSTFIFPLSSVLCTLYSVISTTYAPGPQETSPSEHASSAEKSSKILQNDEKTVTPRVVEMTKLLTHSGIAQKRMPATRNIRAEVVFSFNNYGMKYSYDKKSRKTDYNTCKFIIITL